MRRFSDDDALDEDTNSNQTFTISLTKRWILQCSLPLYLDLLVTETNLVLVERAVGLVVQECPFFLGNERMTMDSNAHPKPQALNPKH